MEGIIFTTGIVESKGLDQKGSLNMFTSKDYTFLAKHYSKPVSTAHDLDKITESIGKIRDISEHAVNLSMLSSWPVSLDAILSVHAFI